LTVYLMFDRIAWDDPVVKLICCIKLVFLTILIKLLRKMYRYNH
jgi:hypothetical protein